MTFSPLTSGTIPHHNKFSSRGGQPITRLIQHHWAGVGGGIERMSDPDQQASCTYVITTDGRILGHVPEEYRPWTSGSAEADAPSVTIEVQNSGGQVNGNDSDPSSWPISDAAYNAIIRLLVDVAQRHGWGAIDADTYLGHRQFYSTACPGGYLWSRMDQTRQLAQAALTGSLSYASESITFQEDELSAEFEADARGEFDGLRLFQADVRGELDKLRALDIDVRGDLANKGVQLAALTAANDKLVSLLADSKGLSVDDIRAALTTAIADGIKVTVEAK